MTKVTSSLIRGSIELCNSKGEAEKTIPYTVNVTRTAQQVQGLRLEMAKAGEAGEVEKLGEVVVNLMSVLFGEETTGELLNYYAQDYTTLMVDLTPILVDEIFPAFDAQRRQIVNAKKRLKH